MKTKSVTALLCAVALLLCCLFFSGFAYAAVEALPPDYALSGQMVDYLVNFAHSGDPNGNGLPHWTPSSAQQKQVMILGEADTAMGKPKLLKMIHTMLTNKAVGE